MQPHRPMKTFPLIIIRIGFLGPRFRVKYWASSYPRRVRVVIAHTDADRDLLACCLRHEAGAWRAFVDRFLGLIFHVVERTSQMVGMPLRSADVEDVAAEVLLQVIKNDFAVLRRFRRQSS